MGCGMGSQFFRGLEPIRLGRSFGATFGQPDFMSARRDLVVSKCGGAPRHFMSVLGVLQRLSRVFMSCQVILFSALLVSGAMGVRGDVVKFRRPLVVFIMRSVVIASGHNLKTHDLPGFRMGFPGEFMGALRVLQGALSMPVSGRVIPFFVVLRSGAMGECRPFVFLCRSSV
jgi:hypothetical protein